MKTKNLISVILFIFFTALILVSFVSCNANENSDSIPTNQENPKQNQTPADNDGEQPAQPEEQSEFIPVEGIDYGGYTFRILGYDGEASGTWQVAAISEIIADEETGDPINDAIYKRNREVEALYNIEFDIVPVTYPNRGDFAAKFNKAVLAGDDQFDAAFMLGDSLPAALSKKDTSFDLLTIQSLDLSKSWWDQNSKKAMSIGGKLSAVIGDVNLYSAFAPLAIFTNKQLLQDYNIDNLYQLVRDGKWTWDAMHEIMKTVTKDLNGDGVITKDDQVGLFAQYLHLYPAINSAGEYMAVKDNNDMPALSPDKEKVSGISEKVGAIFKDKSTTVMADDISGYGNVFFEFIMPKFRDGQILFHINQLLLSFELRNMDADFAILPFPKYDESQDNYGAIVHPAWGTYTVIPITCTDTERTGNILQAMGYYSQQYVMPAYYDVTVTNKLTRDDDSLEMMNIIFGNRQFDLAYLYNWGDINGMFTSMSSSGRAGEFVSQFEKKEPLINSAIQKTLDVLEGIE
ncbi:MAG: extracellular solute-binding protein [Oscillospiraceae bacterium]|nr:extracellular solute-binding protein [Oscillospiraceae bacterium]